LADLCYFFSHDLLGPPCIIVRQKHSFSLYYFFLKRYNFGEVEGGNRRGDRTEGRDISLEEAIIPVKGSNDDCHDMSGDGVCGAPPIQK